LNEVVSLPARSGRSTLQKFAQPRSPPTRHHPGCRRLLRDVPASACTCPGGVSSLPAIHGLAEDRLASRSMHGFHCHQPQPHEPADVLLDPTNVPGSRCSPASPRSAWR
jgi:hypothetical protein